MFFASAAFLAGLALLTVPWWLHRLNAHAAEQRTFSSLFLMRPSEAPVNMRKQLQHFFLLTLRWLLLIAACLAFAEPFIELTGTAMPAAESDAHRLIVVDASLSMQATRGDTSTFELARATARELAGNLPSGVKAAVITASHTLDLITPLTDDGSRLMGAIASLQPATTHLEFARLMGRVTALGESLAEPGERLQIHLISDFQASNMPDQFNALLEGSAWPFELHPVGELEPAGGNRAISAIQISNAELAVHLDGLQDGPQDEEIEVAVSRNGVLMDTRTLTTTTGGASVAFPIPAAEDDVRRQRPVVWRAEIRTEDVLAADNVHHFVSADTVAMHLPVVSGTENRETADAAFAYLQAAVRAAAPRFEPERTSDPMATAAPVIALLDPGRLSGTMERNLIRYLESGGAVLMTAGPLTRSAGRLPLLDLPLSSDRFEQTPRGMTALDRSHPALAGFSNWQEVTFFQMVRTTEGAGEVILALDDGNPLLTEYRIGSGRLMLLGTALDPSWSTLVVRPAFVSFTANLLGYLAEDLLPSDALVGRPFSIPAQNVQLFSEAGERVLGLSETVGRPTVSLEVPGIYQLRTPASTRLLAVNVDPTESDLLPIDTDTLARWQRASADAGVPTTAGRNATQKPVTASQESVREFPLAPWLLGLLALLVLVEPLYANLFSGRTLKSRQDPAGAAA